MPTPSKQKKTITKKTIKKRKYTKKKKELFSLKQKISTMFCLFFLVSAFTYGYYLGEQSLLEKHKNLTKKNISIVKKSRKPKLIIIIDDVHTSSQLASIKALKLKVTPSIFPPYSLSSNSHKLAINLKHYMIHLPMESKSKQFNKQFKTLMVSHSNKNIEKRIKELRVLFPNAKYINNHTGSVFTSNYKAMSSAYGYMKKYKFKFIDSKTSPNSKVKQIARKYKDKYLYRDIFLDNTQEVSYIKKQLKKAVKLAQKHGYAIAIGHPYKATIRALSSSKNILDLVDVVYIDDLF